MMSRPTRSGGRSVRGACGGRASSYPELPGTQPTRMASSVFGEASDFWGRGCRRALVAPVRASAVQSDTPAPKTYPGKPAEVRVMGGWLRD